MIFTGSEVEIRKKKPTIPTPGLIQRDNKHDGLLPLQIWWKGRGCRLFLKSLMQERIESQNWKLC